MMNQLPESIANACVTCCMHTRDCIAACTSTVSLQYAAGHCADRDQNPSSLAGQDSTRPTAFMLEATKTG